MDVAVMGADDLDSFRAARRGDYAVAVAGEYPPGHLAQRLLILHDQDGFSLGRPLGRHVLWDRHGCLRSDRQHDAEDRARAGFGVDLDVAPGVAQDTVHRGPARARTRHTVARPSPVPAPAGLVVKNASNACSITSGGIPQPPSLTCSRTF